jgi:CDP-4-dehydro-6-deoxyglucose reductase, E1|tara:strand:+ start:2398 stop:3591 length:1194 start_codon:yes stop_codon:yes gene_type:complete
MRINYGQSVHGNKEIQAVVKVLKTSTRMGKNVKTLEKKIASYFGKKHSLMVNSGSSALLLLSEILKIKKGDEFITPVLTFPTSISPFLQKGMIAKFLDINLETLQIDEKLIERSINRKTKLIIVPNLIGNIANWKIINKIAKKYKLITIEDSADTIGGTIDGKSSGIYSDYSITSFYGSHIINCMGNGGALCLNKKKDYIKSKIIRSWGRTSSLFETENFNSRFKFKLNNVPYDKKFVFNEMGYNLEPSEAGAAFGLVQINKLKKNIKIRRRNFELHTKFFNRYQKYFVIPKEMKGIYTPWLAFPLIVKENKDFNRTNLQKFLEKSNIQTRPIFTGNILYQPAYKHLKKFNKENYKNGDLVTKGGLLIGLHQGINDVGIKYIHKIFNNFFKTYCKKI